MATHHTTIIASGPRVRGGDVRVDRRVATKHVIGLQWPWSTSCVFETQSKMTAVCAAM